MPFKGTPMQDIHHSEGPWNHHTLPIVVSTYHTILFQLKSGLESPPKPHASGNSYHWDQGYVRMPFSPRNVYPSKDDNGDDILVSRWELIKTTLQQEITSSRELEAAINAYNSRLPKFYALHSLFEQEFDEHESRHFFAHLLPRIVKLALQLDVILPGNIPLLSADHCKSISLSQKQIASLLANAFLCTFSGRKSIAQNYPSINFIGLFSANNESVIEKIKCIVHYFKRVLDKMPCGVVTFERQHTARANLPRWDRIAHNLGNVRVHIASEGTIEDDGLGLLQVDFANKFLGGGVLGSGCVQEEIRFVICPELIISRLFVEKLNNNESLTVTGVERFSRYKGYGDTFEWDGNYKDETPYDDYGRRRTAIVAIDATHYSRSAEQFKPGQVLRELNKAYAGFYSRAAGQLPAVATGNWGCGAFGGNVHLKFLVQLMACSAARRDLVYFTFGSASLRDEIYNMYTFLATNQIQISELWRLLCQFPAAGLNAEQFFAFVQQAYFDTKKQPKISQVFGQLREKCEKREDQTASGEKQTAEVSSKANVSKSTVSLVDEQSSSSGSNNNMDFESFHEVFNEKTDPDTTVRTSPLMHKRKRKTSATHLSTDLISLINKIDGSPNKSASAESEHNTSWGFLNCVDEYAKTNKSPSKPAGADRSTSRVLNTQSHTVVDIEDDEEMDVEDILENLADSKDNKVVKSFTNTSTPNKKKITDYFKKP